jgi:hypothetical protein
MAARTIASAFLATVLLGCGGRPLRFAPPVPEDGGATDAASTPFAAAPPATGGGLASGGGPSSGTGMAGMAPVPGGTGATGGGGPFMGAGGAGGTASAPSSLVAAPWVIEGRGKYTELAHAVIALSQNGTRVLDGTGMLWVDGGGPAPTLASTMILPPTGMSADGSMVFGAVGPPPCPMATIWSAGKLFPTGVLARLVATSGNGSAVVATLPEACPPGGTRAYISFPSSPGSSLRLFAIERLAGDDANAALGITPDGKFALGFSWSSTSGTGRLFLSSPPQAGTVSALPLHDTPIRRPSLPVFMNTAGSVVAGTVTDGGGNDVAFVWSSAGGAATTHPLSPLQKLAARGQTLAFGLSADGAVVLALGTNAPEGPILGAQDGLPFITGPDGGHLQMLVLEPPVIGLESVVMTPDASLIVGNPSPNLGTPPIAWDAQRQASFLFSDAPMFVQRCHPIALFVSADGKTFAGDCDASARTTGFVARLP